MSDKLTTKEIEKIIEKLRSQYEENLKLYGPYYFNLKGFNDRYLQALKARIDLQTFIAAEVTAFQDMKKIVDDKIREHKIKTEKTFTKKVEKMIDEMSEKTRKHPALFEGSDLPEEVQRLCGGLNAFHDREWLLLERLIGKNDIKNTRAHAELSGRFQKYFIHSKGGLSYMAEKFLSTERQDGYDKAHISFLREAAILIREAMALLDGLVLNDGAEILHLPSPPADLAAFDSKPRAEVLGLVKESLSGLVADFRLTDLI